MNKKSSILLLFIISFATLIVFTSTVKAADTGGYVSNWSPGDDIERSLLNKRADGSSRSDTNYQNPYVLYDAAFINYMLSKRWTQMFKNIYQTFNGYFTTWQDMLFNNLIYGGICIEATGCDSLSPRGSPGSYLSLLEILIGSGVVIHFFYIFSQATITLTPIVNFFAGVLTAWAFFNLGIPALNFVDRLAIVTAEGIELDIAGGETNMVKVHEYAIKQSAMAQEINNSVSNVQSCSNADGDGGENNRCWVSAVAEKIATEYMDKATQITTRLQTRIGKSLKEFDGSNSDQAAIVSRMMHQYQAQITGPYMALKLFGHWWKNWSEDYSGSNGVAGMVNILPDRAAQGFADPHNYWSEVFKYTNSGVGPRHRNIKIKDTEKGMKYLGKFFAFNIPPNTRHKLWKRIVRDTEKGGRLRKELLSVQNMVDEYGKHLGKGASGESLVSGVIDVFSDFEGSDLGPYAVPMPPVYALNPPFIKSGIPTTNTEDPKSVYKKKSDKFPDKPDQITVVAGSQWRANQLADVDSSWMPSDRGDWAPPFMNTHMNTSKNINKYVKPVYATVGNYMGAKKLRKTSYQKAQSMDDKLSQIKDIVKDMKAGEGSNYQSRAERIASTSIFLFSKDERIEYGQAITDVIDIATGIGWAMDLVNMRGFTSFYNSWTGGKVTTKQYVVDLAHAAKAVKNDFIFNAKNCNDAVQKYGTSDYEIPNSSKTAKQVAKKDASTWESALNKIKNTSSNKHKISGGDDTCFTDFINVYVENNWGNKWQPAAVAFEHVKGEVLLPYSIDAGLTMMVPPFSRLNPMTEICRFYSVMSNSDESLADETSSGWRRTCKEELGLKKKKHVKYDGTTFHDKGVKKLAYWDGTQDDSSPYAISTGKVFDGSGGDSATVKDYAHNWGYDVVSQVTLVGTTDMIRMAFQDWFAKIVEALLGIALTAATAALAPWILFLKVLLWGLMAAGIAVLVFLVWLIWPIVVLSFATLVLIAPLLAITDPKTTWGGFWAFRWYVVMVLSAIVWDLIGSMYTTLLMAMGSMALANVTFSTIYPFPINVFIMMGLTAAAIGAMWQAPYVINTLLTQGSKAALTASWKAGKAGLALSGKMAAAAGTGMAAGGAMLGSKGAVAAGQKLGQAGRQIQGWSGADVPSGGDVTDPRDTGTGDVDDANIEGPSSSDAKREKSGTQSNIAAADGEGGVETMNRDKVTSSQAVAGEENKERGASLDKNSSVDPMTYGGGASTGELEDIAGADNDVKTASGSGKPTSSGDQGVSEAQRGGSAGGEEVDGDSEDSTEYDYGEDLTIEGGEYGDEDGWLSSSVNTLNDWYEGGLVGGGDVARDDETTKGAAQSETALKIKNEIAKLKDMEGEVDNIIANKENHSRGKVAAAKKIKDKLEKKRESREKLLSDTRKELFKDMGKSALSGVKNMAMASFKGGMMSDHSSSGTTSFEDKLKDKLDLEDDLNLDEGEKDILEGVIKDIENDDEMSKEEKIDAISGAADSYDLDDDKLEDIDSDLMDEYLDKDDEN